MNEYELSNLRQQVNQKVIESFSYQNRPMIMMDGASYISDFHLHCSSSVDLILYTDYLKSLISKKLDVNTISTLKFKHSTVISSDNITNVEEYQKECLKQTLERVSSDENKAKTILQNRYCYLFDFEHPFTNERYYVLIDRVFRDFIIVQNLSFLNVKGLSLSSSLMIKSIAVGSTSNNKSFLSGNSNQSISTSVSKSEITIEDSLNLGNTMDDILDSFTLTNIEVGLLYLNNRYYNGEKFITCKFKDGADSSYFSVNKDYEAFICISFGTLTNYLKSSTDLDSFYNTFNIKTIIPRQTTKEKYCIEHVRNYLDDNSPSIDIRTQEFCVLLKVL